MKRLIFLALSLALHLMFSKLLMFIPTPPSAMPPIEVEIISKSKPQTTRQVVRQVDVPNDLLTEQTEEKLRFLSEKTQSVKKQMRALKSGMSQNRSLKKSTTSTLKDLKGGEVFLPPMDKQVDLSGLSTFGHDVPKEVSIGEMTVLNTDRYLYYTYYARSEAALRQEWEPLVETIYANPPKSIRDSVHRKFTTVIEVWYKPNGELHSTHILKPSGSLELDRIAEISWQLVKMIPNPPQAKIESDGLVRMKWNMIVEFQPKVLVRKQQDSEF